MKEFEEANKLIRETTGADDINEICQKYSNLRETKDKLKKEKKDLERLCDTLSKKKDELALELKTLKYKGQDEITRKEIDDNEKTVERNIKDCEEMKNKLKKSEKLLTDLRAGIGNINEILKSKVFEEIFTDEKNFSEKENDYKLAYKDLILMPEKDSAVLLSKVKLVSDYLFQRYKFFKENFPSEDVEKLNRKDENELEQIYLHHSSNESEDSYSGNDDEGIDNKDYAFNKDKLNPIFRSQTADPKKRNKITLRAIDKKDVKKK